MTSCILQNTAFQAVSQWGVVRIRWHCLIGSGDLLILPLVSWRQLTSLATQYKLRGRKAKPSHQFQHWPSCCSENFNTWILLAPLLHLDTWILGYTAVLLCVSRTCFFSLWLCFKGGTLLSGDFVVCLGYYSGVLDSASTFCCLWLCSFVRRLVPFCTPWVLVTPSSCYSPLLHSSASTT